MCNSSRKDRQLVKPQVIQPEKPQRWFGGLKGLVVKMGDSFDDELEDFAEYTPLSIYAPGCV